MAKERLNRFGKRPDPQPTTSVPYDAFIPAIGRSPMALLPPYRMVSDNADIPRHGVFGVGPQSGNAHARHNLGSMILPGAKKYLEMAGQKQVGVLPRTIAFMPTETWDTPYAINPTVEVI